MPLNDLSYRWDWTAQEEAELRPLRPKVQPLVLAMLCARLVFEVLKDAPQLGSLIHPQRDARDLLATWLKDDPPVLREWVVEEMCRFVEAMNRVNTDDVLDPRVIATFVREVRHASQ